MKIDKTFTLKEKENFQHSNEVKIPKTKEKKWIKCVFTKNQNGALNVSN